MATVAGISIGQNIEPSLFLILLKVYISKTKKKKKRLQDG